MSELSPVSFRLFDVKGLAGKHELRLGKPIPGQGRLIALIGDNGVGKSSFLAGIRGLFGGGWDPSLINKDAEKCLIEADLSDGTALSRSVTRTKGGSYPKVETPEGQPPVKQIETYLKKLASGCGFDPLKFCEMDRKERLTYLMSVMGDLLTFTADEVKTAMGPAAALITAPPEWTIDSINAAIKTLVETRQKIGGSREEKSSTVDALRKTLIASDQGGTPKDWISEVTRLGKEKSLIDQAERSDLKAIDIDRDAFFKAHDRVMDAAVEAARNEFTSLLSSAREGKTLVADALDELEVRLTAVSSESTKRLTARKVADDAQAEISSTAAEKRITLEGQIATARAASEEQVRIRTTQELKDAAQKSLEKLTADWESCKSAIDNLSALRVTKLKGIKIEGLDIRDGAIFIGDLDFDEINTGQQYWKALEIGTLGAGELNLVIIDKAEHLGPKNWKLLDKAVVASGLTVIAGRVASAEEIKQFGEGLRSEPAGALVS